MKKEDKKSVIKPRYTTQISYTQDEILAILDLKLIYPKYISEGNAEVESGVPNNGGKFITPKEMLLGISNYLRDNEIIGSDEIAIGRFVTTHYFGTPDDDKDGCRRSNYNTEYEANIWKKSK